MGGFSVGVALFGEIVTVRVYGFVDPLERIDEKISTCTLCANSFKRGDCCRHLLDNAL